MSYKFSSAYDADDSRIRQLLTKLGDIYTWKEASKACFISLVISSIPFIMFVWFLLNYLTALNNNGMTVIPFTTDELLVATKYSLGLVFFLLLISIVATWCVTKDKYHKEILYITLFSIAVSQSVLLGIVGIFDGVSWLLLLIYISIAFVLLTRTQVFITATMIVLFLMLWSVSYNYLPFHVRAYQFTNEIELANMTWLDLAASWGAVLATSMFCSFVLDMLMGAWRHREEDLHSKSFMDELTSLLNRRAIQDGLKEEFFRARRGEYDLSVALLDLDHFKKINDSYGHPFGDKVLKLVAAKMSEVIRKKDLLGRYGGEEFLIVFPECESQQAMLILERLRENLEKQSIATDSGEQVTVTLSGGIAQLQENDQLETLVARADKALYQAKESGRDRVIYV